MTQAQWLILAFKIVTISAFISLVAWVIQYHRYTHGNWRHDEIGRTFVIKTGLIALLLVPTILSLFFSFSRLTSHVAGWVDVAILGAVTPVMIWRITVFRRIHDGGGEDDVGH